MNLSDKCTIFKSIQFTSSNKRCILRKALILMKIKDFLQNFVGQSTGTRIEVYDKHSFKTYQFHHVQEVIDRLGYYSIKEWTICNNILKITIQTQF